MPPPPSTRRSSQGSQAQQQKKCSTLSATEARLLRDNRIAIEALLEHRVARPTSGLLGDNSIASEVFCAVEHAESLVLIGPSGCGKTASAWRGLQQHNASKPGCVVALSGELHADERIALLESARQLCAFLCQPFGDAPLNDNAQFVEQCSFHVTSHLCTPLTFVLDEFDHFASAPNGSSLLYRIADAAASAGASIIACARRHDTFEKLEKRARSRLGHRHVDLGTLGGKVDIAPSSAQRIAAIMRDAVAPPSPSNSNEEHARGLSSDVFTALNNALELAMHDAWYELERAATHGFSACDITSLLLFSLQQSADGYPTRDDLCRSLGKAAPVDDDIAAHLAAAPPLDLAIACAAARMHKFRNQGAFTFDDLMSEYSATAGAAKLGAGPFSRRLCLRSFERHLSHGVLERTAKRQRLSERQESRLVVPTAVIEDGIARNQEAPSLLKNALSHEAIA